MEAKTAADPNLWRIVFMTFGLIILMVTLFVVLALLSPTTATYPNSKVSHLIETTIAP